MTSIGSYAFYGCTGLTSITIPNSVTSIESEAFYGCTGLTNVTLGDSVTSIGYGAFYGCTGLTSITIPNSVTSIESKAFYGCYNLKTVYNYSGFWISKGYSNNGYVGYYASVVINADDQVGDFFFKTIDGVDNLVAYIGNDNDLALPENYNGENYVIGYGAFEGCSSLTSVTIPNSVTSIGDKAFCGCDSLKSLIIPNSVTSIGDAAFEGCEDLKVIVNLTDCHISANCAEYVIEIDDEKYEIYGDFVFRNNDNYEFYLSAYIGYEENVTLPENFYGKGYNLDDCAFYNRPNITNIIIPNSVTNIGDYAFSNCTGLASIIIPDLVTSIGDNAFYGCVGLTSVTVPDMVASIGDNAFSGCTNLAEVAIGSSIANIGNYVFKECDNLNNITIAATTPPMVGNHDFDKADFRTIVVKVPQGSLAAYQTADFWKSFWNIEEFEANGIEDVQMGTHNTTAPIYTLQGIQVKEAKENLPAGIYIQSGKKFIVK